MTVGAKMLPLAHVTTFRARALYVGERLDLKLFRDMQPLAEHPTAVPAGEQGVAVLFRFGAVVTFNLSAAEEEAFLGDLEPLVSDGFPRPEAEEMEIQIDGGRGEGVAGSRISLSEATIERLQLVAIVLCRSVVLAEYEKRIAASFDRIEPLARTLEERGREGRNARQLLRHIGSVLLMEHKMVGRVEVREKPELLWEQPALEPLYARLSEEFELGDRHRALERKLDLLGRTVETVLDLLHNRRTLRVEWYIVILIVTEIALTLYQLFVNSAGG